MLAPRGWHCHGYEQAGTATLVVSPESLSAHFVKPKKKVVQGIVDGLGLDKRHYALDPYPDDILTCRSDGDVEFETPANKDGMGTMFGLVKNADPIRGMAELWETMDDNKNKSARVVLLVVRMPPQSAASHSHDHGKHAATP